MLIPAVAWRALLESGVEVLTDDARHLVLGYGEHRRRLAVHNVGRTLNPSDIAALSRRDAEQRLLIVPSFTRAARTTAERVDWSWLVADGRRVHGVLQLGPTRVEIDFGFDPESVAEGSRKGRTGRVAWGTLTVVRHLLSQRAPSQKALASLVRISQPRVSQILRELSEQRLIQRDVCGWVAGDPDALVDWWLDRYPGPGGINTHWYGLDSPQDQALSIIRGVREGAAGRGLEAVVSGDVAADLIAPWRTPQRAVVYVSQGVDPAEFGLTPAGAEEATLDLIVPRDPGVWTGAGVDRSMPVADLLQVLWDVRRIGGPDEAEATARLRGVLRSRLSGTNTMAQRE